MKEKNSGVLLIFWRLQFFLCLLLVFIWSFETFSQEKKAKQIELLNANSLEYDESLGTRAKRLIGNVALKHEGTYMYCDSAYLFSEENRFDAFGHIHIKPQGSSHLYGDSLRYFGNTQMAHIRGRVKLIDKEYTLHTTAMDYNVETDLAYYMNGGTILNANDSSVLTSTYGYFYPKQNEFFFKQKVKVTHPEYEINCDTLKYNTEAKMTYFLGPTTIKNKDNFIYCENGWHDSDKNISRFGKNAYMQNERQKLLGDSIIYDRNLLIGRAFGNVKLIDTTEKMIISGNLLIHHEKDSISLITGKAMLTQFYETDTLYLHADTLLSKYDSAFGGTDSVEKFRTMFAFHKVTFYKTDMQGKCDSLVFSDIDSTIKMFTQPIIWSNENQMTADYIEIATYSGKVQSMLFDKNAFIISEVDPDSPNTQKESLARYNQIKGAKMIGHFSESKLVMVDVLDKGETVYYAKESPSKEKSDSLAMARSDSLKISSTGENSGDEEIIGVNLADCDSMVIYVQENKVQRISFKGNISAALHPIDQISYEETLLKGFSWKGKHRPRKKEDIFVFLKD